MDSAFPQLVNPINPSSEPWHSRWLAADAGVFFATPGGLALSGHPSEADQSKFAEGIRIARSCPGSWRSPT